MDVITRLLLPSLVTARKDSTPKRFPIVYVRSHNSLEADSAMVETTARHVASIAAKPAA
jgi:hypothetical protein